MIKYQRITILGIAAMVKREENDGRVFYKVRVFGNNIVYDIYAPSNEQMNKYLDVDKNVKATGMATFKAIDNNGILTVYCKLTCKRIVVVDTTIKYKNSKKEKKKKHISSLFNNSQQDENIRYEEIEI